MLVEGAVVPELVGQVEDHVRAEGLQFLPQEVEVVERVWQFDADIMMSSVEVSWNGRGLRPKRLPGVACESQGH